MEDARQPVMSWAVSKADWAEAARFFARVLAADPAYISHGEIQAGLSLDGKTWAPNLEKRFLDELGEYDDPRRLAIARNAAGEIVAAANVTWAFEVPEAPFATLQDLAVEPSLRSAGLGASLFQFVEAEVSRRAPDGCSSRAGKAMFVRTISSSVSDFPRCRTFS